MIIWGTRGITSTTQTGVFHCPRCGPQRAYSLRRVRRWFTLYFIPVIPLDTVGEYIECQQCAGTFGADVLTYDPAAAERQLVEQITRVLVVATLAAGPSSESRMATLQQTVSELTDVHVTAEELWKECRLAQSAGVQFVPYVQRVAGGFSETGKQKILAGAYRILSYSGGCLPPEEEIVRQLGAALGIASPVVDALLQKLKTIS